MQNALTLRKTRTAVSIQRRDALHFFAFLLLTYLLIVFGIAYSNVLIVVSFLLSICFIFLSDVKKGLGLQFFLLSFQYVYKITPGSFSLFSFLNIAVTIKLLLSLVRIKRNALRTGHFLYLFFLLFVVVQTILLSSPMLSTIGFMLNLFLLIVVLSLTDDRIKLDDVSIFIQSLIFGIIISSITALLKNYIPNLNSLLHEVYYKTEQVRTMRFNGLIHNPNWYSLDVIVALCSLLVYMLKKRSFSILYCAEIALLILFGILTLSKSFLLSLLVLLLLLFIYLIKKPKTLILFVVLLLLFSSVAFFLFGGYLTSIFDRLGESDSLDGFTSGRTEIWVAYLRTLFNDPRALFFGFGYLNTPTYLGDSHSLYFDFFSFFGIFGATLLFFCLATLFPKKKKRDFLSLFVLIIILFRGLAINMLNNDSFYYYMILAAMLYKLEPAEKTEVRRRLLCNI